MSGETITRYLLRCDGGCGTERGTNGEYANAMEARAAAYADGWRFPSKTLTNGKPSARTLDLCPACQALSRLPAIGP